MNPVDFCFWLQGHFELSDSTQLSDEQVKKVKEHLNLVFLHSIDPARDAETTATVQELNQAHAPGTFEKPNVPVPTGPLPAKPLEPDKDKLHPGPVYTPQQNSNWISNDPLVRC